MSEDDYEERRERVARTFFDAEDVAEVLPAWFIPKMMDEGGLFAFILVSGQILAVDRIERVHLAADDSIWLDALLAPRPAYAAYRGPMLFYAPAEGLSVSIQLSHVVAVFEASPGEEGSAWHDGNQ